MSALPTPTELEPREDELLDGLSQVFEEAYDANGVDRSLIRWSLSRTPTERVMAAEDTLKALATLKRRTTPEGA